MDKLGTGRTSVQEYTGVLSTLAIDVGRTEALGSISDENLRNKIELFLAQGFVVFPSAVNPILCEDLKKKIESGFEGRAQCTYWDSDGQKKIQPFERHMLNRPECKILGAHSFDRDAKMAIFVPAIKEFLEVVFGDIPIAFQSLAFIRGSEQRVHDDRTFVVVDPPNNFIASWIALEDIRPGSGALCYYPYSHKLEPHIFRDGSLSRYTDDEIVNYPGELVRKAERNGLSIEEFYPKQGDVLLWHSALIHGGSKIEDERSTRYSFVTHYCPLKSLSQEQKLQWAKVE